MAVYTYVCDTCGAESERTHSVKVDENGKGCRAPVVFSVEADGETYYWPCPGKIKRVISSGTSFKLLGGGWAASGYQKY